jgi:co-chaperonin GroES (HSP10)
MTPTNHIGVRPIRDQVVIRRDPAETLYKTLIHRPQGSEEWPERGTVLAIGPLVTEPGIAPGARVLFQARPGTALVPARLEPDQRKDWERVVVLRSGDADRAAPARPHAPSGTGDILAIIEEE